MAAVLEVLTVGAPRGAVLAASGPDLPVMILSREVDQGWRRLQRLRRRAV